MWRVQVDRTMMGTRQKAQPIRLLGQSHQRTAVKSVREKRVAGWALTTKKTPRFSNHNTPSSEFYKLDVFKVVIVVFSTSIKEDHGQSIFGVQFNYHLRKDQPLMFASCGTNRISVYECPKEGGLKMLQAYADPDVSIVIRYPYVRSFGSAWR